MISSIKLALANSKTSSQRTAEEILTAKEMNFGLTEELRQQLAADLIEEAMTCVDRLEHRITRLRYNEKKRDLRARRK